MSGAERMVPNLGTLTIYGDPEPIGQIEKPSSADEEEDEEASVAIAETSITPKTPQYFSETQSMLADRSRGPSCPDPASLALTDLREILNILVPSKEWTEETENAFILWKQDVSLDAPRRDQITRCAEELKERMKSREARANGLCPIRRELYSQVFDEVIRQVTIACPERGLLLMRVRDELRMTIDAWKSLYESTKSFGSEETSENSTEVELGVDESKAELEIKMQEIQKKKKELTEYIEGVDDALALKEIKYKEQVDAWNKKQFEDVELLKRLQQQYQEQLELFAGENPHIAKKTGRMLDQLFTKDSKSAVPDGK